jgi:glycosyltransferase involved in cell wall biosynthesis
MDHPIVIVKTMPPQVEATAQFNASLWRALDARTQTHVVGWRNIYPRVPGRTVVREPASVRPWTPRPDHLLAWHDPRTWRRASRRIAELEPRAIVLAWLHPVMAPPYRYLLSNLPAGTSGVVVCHNVLPHERVPLAARLTSSALSKADVLVTHAPDQRRELERLGISTERIQELFHPRYVPSELADPPSRAAVAAERARHDADLVLLVYGAVRRYKGVDLTLEAMARMHPDARVKVIVAGRFGEGADELAALRARLGMEKRVEFRPGYVSDRETAVLFSACDAVLMTYRSATQSGVCQLAFGFGKPVIATRVGGLPAAVRDGVDGLLCDPNPAAIAATIHVFAARRGELTDGVEPNPYETSFDRYAGLLLERIDGAHAALGRAA